MTGAPTAFVVVCAAVLSSTIEARIVKRTALQRQPGWNDQPPTDQKKATKDEVKAEFTKKAKTPSPMEVEAARAASWASRRRAGLGDATLTQHSTESFGVGGPSVKACPWYKWTRTGRTMLPRGPSYSNIAYRQQTLQAKMDSFRAGGDFIIVKGGTELNAHVGGPQNQGNDMDLDAVIYSVTQASSLIDMVDLQRPLFGDLPPPPPSSRSETSVLHVSTEVKLDAKGMPAGGYGSLKLSKTGQETKQFIENEVCLCVAGGSLTLCDVHPDLRRYGETYWMPLPNSKNLGLGFILATYLEQDFGGWRQGSIADLLTWDVDRNGKISLEEVMKVGPSKGVSSAWLEMMTREDPCELVNAAISADFSLHLCQDIALDKATLQREFTHAGLWPPGDHDLKGQAFLKNKYGVKFLENKAECHAILGFSEKKLRTVLLK